MKKNLYIYFLALIAMTTTLSSCKDDSLYPYPATKNGASFVADLERPDNVFTSNANINAVSLPAATGGTFAFKTSSANASEIAKVEMFVKYTVSGNPAALPNPSDVYGILVKEFTTFGTREEFSVAQLAGLVNVPVANLRPGNRFQLIFVATMKDGRVFTGGTASSNADFRTRPLGQIFTTAIVVTLI